MSEPTTEPWPYTDYLGREWTIDGGRMVPYEGGYLVLDPTSTAPYALSPTTDAGWKVRHPVGHVVEYDTTDVLGVIADLFQWSLYDTRVWLGGDHYRQDDDATIGWPDYVTEAGTGYFEVTFPAQALAEDLSTVVGEATIAITAEAGEFEGVTLVFALPRGLRRSVWFTADDDVVGNAQTFATALAGASATAEAIACQAPAWYDDDPPQPVTVGIVTNPAVFDGVYLDIGALTDADTDPSRPKPVLVSRQHAAHAAQAIHTAIDYLIFAPYVQCQ